MKTSSITQNCPLCGRKDTSRLFPVGDSDIEVWNVVCKNCALVFLERIPDEKEYELYQGKSGRGSGHHRKRSAEELKRKLYGSDERIKRSAVRYLLPHLKPKARVLDIGCGYGNLLRILEEETGITGEGIEMNGEDVRIAKEYLGLDIHSGTLAEFYEREKEKHKYNAIIVHHTIEHMPDPLAELARIKELLADDGILYVAVPNIMNMKKRPESFFILGHAFSYSPSTLVRMLSKAGFFLFDLNENASYPGGMEAIFKKADAAPSRHTARDSDWRAVRRVVARKKRQFDALRTAKETALFWLPRSTRNNIGRFALRLLRRLT